MRNETVDALTNAAARITPLRDRFTVEILYKTSIPKSITNLFVFDDDEHILHFMASADVLKDAAISAYEHEEALQCAANKGK